MDVDIFFSAAEAERGEVQGRVAVVIDVLRATSTIVEALANGAVAIYPTAGTEEAIKLATSLGREDTLLCGERKGLKIEGYDLGNSPREFTKAAVRGKRLVMNTTNGTRAFLAAQAAERVLAASFLNLSAVAGALEGAEAVTFVCAGREDRFGLEDAVCAGAVLRTLRDGPGAELGLRDGGRAALLLAEAVAVDGAFLGSTRAGRALAAAGLEPDMAICAEVDRHAIVPEMQDRMIRVPGR